MNHFETLKAELVFELTTKMPRDHSDIAIAIVLDWLNTNVELFGTEVSINNEYLRYMHHGAIDVKKESRYKATRMFSDKFFDEELPEVSSHRGPFVTVIRYAMFVFKRRK